MSVALSGVLTGALSGVLTGARIGVKSGAGRRGPIGSGSGTAQAWQIRNEADARLAGHAPEGRDARPVQGLREPAHALGWETGEDVLGEHHKPGPLAGRRRDGCAGGGQVPLLVRVRRAQLHEGDAQRLASSSRSAEVTRMHGS
jgi:hypothetical protein